MLAVDPAAVASHTCEHEHHYSLHHHHHQQQQQQQRQACRLGRWPRRGHSAVHQQLARPPLCPRALQLSSVCSACRAAAEQAPRLSITWHVWSADDESLYSKEEQLYLQGARTQQYREQQQQQERTLGCFTAWLQKRTDRLISFTLKTPDVFKQSDVQAIWAALTSAATAAAAAGTPLPLQELRLPLQQLQMTFEQVYSFPTGNPLPPPPALLAALPRLQRLAMPILDIWWDPKRPWTHEYEKPAVGDKAATLAALVGLRHLSSLEVVLRPMDITWGSHMDGPTCWQEVLEAAPKQLQQLPFRIMHRHHYRPLKVAYDWAPLAASTQLQQLRVDNVEAGVELTPLAQLPPLKRLSLQQPRAAALEPLLVVKGLLQELEVGHVPPEQLQHLEQFTCLTSLTLAKDKEPGCLLPGQVAAGLCQLDWTLEPDVLGRTRRARGRSTDSSSSGSGSGSDFSSSSSNSDSYNDVDLLAGCSSVTLRDLQLRGQGWVPQRAAAAAVQQLTGLTSFGLHAAAGEPLQGLEPGPSPWLSLLPMQGLRQLRRLSAAAGAACCRAAAMAGGAAPPDADLHGSTQLPTLPPGLHWPWLASMGCVGRV